MSPAVKAWLANGLEELRQVFNPGVQQIQPGNNPGVWGTITTGEATKERLEEKAQEMPDPATFEVPEAPKEPAKEVEMEM